ncbi:MAG TPA: glycosyltransferase, partial [Rubricoccaceae bacterium]|nr:glycosyltransferase [Rubricoccaceae bacterium]
MALDVLFALTGDVRRNARAVRQLRALAGMGLHVRALTLGPGGEAPELPGVELVPLPVLKGRGPTFFLGVHRAVRRLARRMPARVYHASDLYTLPALAGAARFHRARLVFDARELYPDTPA